MAEITIQEYAKLAKAGAENGAIGRFLLLFSLLLRMKMLH